MHQAPSSRDGASTSSSTSVCKRIHIDVNDYPIPDWVKDAVFYQIFPDRFAKTESHSEHLHFESWNTPPTTEGFKGGNLDGIRARLDHLVELGVNALYFTPVFASASNHRYHTYDYFNIDPILGGNEAFDRLIADAHRRGMKVVLDGVFNHASRGFFQFNHLLEVGKASPYINWFKVKQFPINSYDSSKPASYECWWNLHALPQFNHDNKDVQEFLFRVAQHWLARGIDGWRLDVPNEVRTPGFWQEFRRRVKAVNRDAYIVGEIWTEASKWLHGDTFDGVMNYMVTKAAIAFFLGTHGDQKAIDKVYGEGNATPIDANSFVKRIKECLAQLPIDTALVQLNLVASHDTPRLLTLAKGELPIVMMANLFMFTFVGSPCIYYGDEIGMEGGPDPDCRRAMQWDRSQWNAELFLFMKKLCRLRRDYEVLRRGSISDWCISADSRGVAFLRSMPPSSRQTPQYILVCLNASASATTLRWTPSSSDDGASDTKRFQSIVWDEIELDTKLHAQRVAVNHPQNGQLVSIEVQLPANGYALLLGRSRS